MMRIPEGISFGRRLRGLVLAAGAAMACCAPAAFAGRTDVGTSGAVFLKLNAGARSVGMGEAFAGVADDVNAIYFNPAGTAFVPGPQFTAQYGRWFQNITYNAMGFVYPLKGGKWAVGLGVVNLGVFDIDRRTGDTVVPDGSFDAADYAYLVNASRAVSRSVSVGVNAKLISQTIDDTSASAFAADAGVLWKTPVRGLTAGAAVQNAGTAVALGSASDPLPLNIKCGAGYGVSLPRGARLVIAADVNMPRDNDMMINGGAEYRRPVGGNVTVALRGGYKTVAQEQLGGLAGLCAGAGIAWKQFGFDCAWVPYGDLGDTFRYSLLVKF